VRNRVKRIVREFFRLHKDLFRENSNSLIRVKGLPESLSMGNMEPELLTLLSSTRRRTSNG